MIVPNNFSVAQNEEQIASHLYDVLESIVNSNDFSLHVETTLDYSSDNDSDDDDTTDESLYSSSDDSDYEVQNTTLRDGLQKFSLDYMQRALDYYDAIDPKTQKRRHTTKGVMRRFPRITHRRYLSRFRTYLQNNGTKKQKIDCINDYVYEKFENARLRFLPVHDRDLCRWGRQKAIEISFYEFQASHHWLISFKRTNDICSRKITRVINLYYQLDLRLF